MSVGGITANARKHPRAITCAYAGAIAAIGKITRPLRPRGMERSPTSRQTHGITSERHDATTARAPLPRRVGSEDVASFIGDCSAPAIDTSGAIQMFAQAINAGVPLTGTAAHGMSGSSGSLPHLSVIQRAFGRHDVSGVQAHVGGAAAEGSAAMGAKAYAADGRVAFAAAPDLHLAAHEAAHVVQQRGGVQLSGGVGASGDPYERHADAVADVVVRGDSAETLLDPYAGGGGGGRGIQRQDTDSPRQERAVVPPAPTVPTVEPDSEADAAALAQLHAAVPEVHAELPEPDPSPAPRLRRSSTARAATHRAPVRAVQHPDHDVSTEFSAHAEAVGDRFHIPSEGWEGERAGRHARINISDTLRAVVTRIRAEPATVLHIRQTLDAFYTDPDPRSRLTREQVDLPLVLAIAARESGPGYAHIILDGGTRRVVPAGGADSVTGGCGGLDYSADHWDQMPTSMRGDLAEVPREGLSAAGQRRPSTPHPLEMPEADVLAAYITEVRVREQRFEARVREHHELTAEQHTQMLAHLSRAARRAWIQVEFGTNAPPAYTTVWGRFDPAMRAHGFEAALVDDDVNLNSIVMDERMADARGVSGHRVRITMAEAAILDEMLPADLTDTSSLVAAP